jgi:hypothetical protein
MKIRLGDLRRIIKEELDKVVPSESMRIENPTSEDYENYAILKSAKESVDKYYRFNKSAEFERLVGLDDPTDGGNYTQMHKLATTAQYFGIDSFDKINDFIEKNSHLQQEKPKDLGLDPHPRGHENPAIRAGWI